MYLCNLNSLVRNNSNYICINNFQLGLTEKRCAKHQLFFNFIGLKFNWCRKRVNWLVKYNNKNIDLICYLIHQAFVNFCSMVFTKQQTATNFPWQLLISFHNICAVWGTVAHYQTDFKFVGSILFWYHAGNYFAQTV